MAEHFCPGCLERTKIAEEVCTACEFVRPDLGWPVDETIGKVVNQKYRITERLGRGGFGVVMRGRHIHDDHDLGDVVLKFMQSSLTQDLSLRRRFINEAKAARSLRSPHVVKVFDFDFDEHGVPFMVMEYLEGLSMSQVIKRSPLSLRQTLRIAIQLAGAMDECHGAGIIHRDLKPSNILLLSRKQGDFAKIIDFGIARVEDSTVTKTMMGTPKYMAPEQIRRDEMDGRTDIFALGIIIHECLCGAPPIKAGDDLQYLVLNLEVQPTPLREVVPDAPVALQGLLLRMMAKDREDRPASMADVEARLRAISSEGGQRRAVALTSLEGGDTIPLRGAAESEETTAAAADPGEAATRADREPPEVTPLPLQEARSQTFGSWIFSEDLRLPENRGRRILIGLGAFSALGLVIALLVVGYTSSNGEDGGLRPRAGGGQDGGLETTRGVAHSADAGAASPTRDAPPSLFVPQPSRRVAGLVRPDTPPTDLGPAATPRRRPINKRPRKAPRRRAPAPYPSIPEDGMW